MTKITILRHAQSLFNAGLSQECDPCLSKHGEDQARKVIGDFDCVIVSPLKRALETYTRSSVKCKRLMTNDLFRERRNGVNCNYFKLENKVIESDEEFAGRARDAFNHLREFVEENNYENILVIAHHDFICQFAKHLGHDNVHLPNCQHISFHI